MKKLRQEVRWNRLQAPFEAVHYPGHIGFPPNECADVTANMGRKAINLPQTIGQILASAGPTPPMPDPPQIIALSDALYWTRIQEAQDPIVSLHCTPTRKIKYDLTFTCATANVLSLKGGQEAVSQPTDTAFPHIQLSAARRLDLAQQFQSHSLTTIGLQETRGRAPKGWDVATYHTYAAPASSRGQGGLEIWITKSFPPRPGGCLCAACRPQKAPYKSVYCGWHPLSFQRACLGQPHVPDGQGASVVG